MNEVITNPLWLQAFQKRQAERFIQRGLPGRKEENWKYIPIAEVVAPYCSMAKAQSFTSPSEDSILSCQRMLSSSESCWKQTNTKTIRLVFIDGSFCAALSQALPAAVKFCPLADVMQTMKEQITTEFDVQRFPFAVLNSAHVMQGLFLQIPATISELIHIIHIKTNDQPIYLRNIIHLEKGAKATILEEYISTTVNYFTNVVTEIKTEKNAAIAFYKIQDEAVTAAHVSHTFVQQCQDSRVEVFTLSKGALLSREDLMVTQAERGAECDLAGLYMLHEDQYADHHVQVEHAAEHGNSAMLYKSILDKKARAVFNGKVHVHPHAQHINAYQANHNLLLSPAAEVNTKPELEIYADNVKCAHGATVGQLDTESLFYFRSRGIAKDQAMQLLLQAFADEVISKIQHTAVRQYILQRVSHHVEL